MDFTHLVWSGPRITSLPGLTAACEYVLDPRAGDAIANTIVSFQQVLFFNFKKNKNLWTYGDFAEDTVNGSAPTDPWQTGRDNTPFDQPFYLVLNVGVGATNGYFP
jgi:hypothetical protein